MTEREITKEEVVDIMFLAQRASELAEYHGVNYDTMTADMDLTNCHLHCFPLDLKAMREADAGNFAHDVFGIARHLDRRTLEMRGCFVPRFALREVK
jgi:hypothetical protein